MVFEIEVRTSFSAAHFLIGIGGPESSLHGHDFEVTAVFTTESINELGMVAYDRDMKKLLGKVIASLDHVTLNDLEVFEGYSPTLDSIANLILVSLQAVTPSQYFVKSVSLRTEANYAVKCVDKLKHTS